MTHRMTHIIDDDSSISKRKLYKPPGSRKNEKKKNVDERLQVTMTSSSKLWRHRIKGHLLNRMRLFGIFGDEGEERRIPNLNPHATPFDPYFNKTVQNFEELNYK